MNKNKQRLNFCKLEYQNDGTGRNENYYEKSIAMSPTSELITSGWVKKY